MKRTGLFKKIFLYTFSVFSVLVICLHLAIYFLFPSTYLSHRQETIGQKATAIAQSLDGKAVSYTHLTLPTTPYV